MNTKHTNRSAIASMIVAVIMIASYFFLGQVYILIAALAGAANGDKLIEILITIVMIIGMASMALALANIVISIITLVKTKKATSFADFKVIALILMILMFIQLTLTTAITVIMVVTTSSIGLVLVHGAFIVLYLILALSILKEYVKNKKAETESVATVVV